MIRVNSNDRKLRILLENNSNNKRKIRKHELIGIATICNIEQTFSNEDEVICFAIKESELEETENVNTTVDSLIPLDQWKPSSVLEYDKNLTKSQKEQLARLVDEYRDVFSQNDQDIGSVSQEYGTHEINLKSEKAIKQRPYVVPHAKEKIINEQVDKMEKMRVIEPTISDWSSPIVLVKKPDGSERFCVDYRKVNEVTEKDCFPMPNTQQATRMPIFFLNGLCVRVLADKNV